jgi:hypothetical protein
MVTFAKHLYIITAPSLFSGAFFKVNIGSGDVSEMLTNEMSQLSWGVIYAIEVGLKKILEWYTSSLL